MSKFLARRTAVQRFNFSPSPPNIPTYPPPSIPRPFCQGSVEEEEFLPAHWNETKWLVDQPRDARNYPLQGFGATVERRIPPWDRDIIDFSRGIINRSFPFSLLAFRPGENLYGIEATMLRRIPLLLLFSLTFFLYIFLEEKGKVKFDRRIKQSLKIFSFDEIKFHYSKFPSLSRSTHCSTIIRLFRNS